VKEKINDFVDLFPAFHTVGQSEQIVLLAYFHAVTQGRESVNKKELERLFALAGTPAPKNLAQLLAYLSTKGKKLMASNGEFEIRREVIKQIDQRIRELRGSVAPPKLDGGSPFDFGSKAFADAKVSALLQELRKCYPQECWNACGLLMRIIVERVLDTVDAGVKGKTGLRDKINACRGLGALSKSIREALDGLHSAKIIGDVAAHHSKVLLDKSDVDLVLPAFRILIKEVTTI
jgi:hypothetical protein